MPSAGTKTGEGRYTLRTYVMRIWDSKSATLRRCLVILLIGLLPAFLYEGARSSGAGQTLAGFAIALLTIHAILLLGAVSTLVFGSICLTVTFAIENLSISTGFPFGRYQFLFDRDLPHVGAVPFIIGPVYCMLCYQAWIIASLIVGTAFGERQDRQSLYSVPIVAAFTATQWDLVTDPENATVNRYWIWSDGGGFLGVPLSNFLGWFLTTWVVFQLFQLFICRYRYTGGLARRGPLFLMLPILIFMVGGLSYIVPPFPADRIVHDRFGRVWSSAAIRTVAETLALFTILPTSCLALIRLGQNRSTVGRSFPE